MRNGYFRVSLVQTKVDGDGTIGYFRDGQLHRDEGPAVITRSGHMVWYRNGRGYSPTTEEVYAGCKEARRWVEKYVMNMKYQLQIGYDLS